MKILLITTASNTVLNFRKDLIKHIQKRGHEVFVIVNDGKSNEEIEKLGVKLFSVEADNRNMNFLKNMVYKKRIRKIIINEKPDMVFTFQIKPNIFGTLSAKKYTRNIYSMVEGLGDVFVKKSLFWSLIRIIIGQMYKKSFKFVKKVFFLNKEDKDFFVNSKLLKESKAVIIDGIGINVEDYTQKEIINFNTFVMVSRLIKSKGVIEYCKAAQLVREKGFEYRFILAGGESELKMTDIQDYINRGDIQYIGYTSNIKQVLEDSTIFVLPSYYREGLPRSSMEAMALGRPILTTNSVGCKETVIEGYNGLLCNPKDEIDLSNKMIEIMSNKKNIICYGNNSRELVVKRFNQEKINNIILAHIFENN